MVVKPTSQFVEPYKSTAVGRGIKQTQLQTHYLIDSTGLIRLPFSQEQEAGKGICTSRRRHVGRKEAGKASASEKGRYLQTRVIAKCTLFYTVSLFIKTSHWLLILMLFSSTQ